MAGQKKVPGDRGNGGLATVATFRSWRDSQAATPQPLTRGTLGREGGDATGILKENREPGRGKKTPALDHSVALPRISPKEKTIHSGKDF